jgi:hypothetical protein
MDSEYTDREHIQISAPPRPCFKPDGRADFVPSWFIISWSSGSPELPISAVIEPSSAICAESLEQPVEN